MKRKNKFILYKKDKEKILTNFMLNVPNMKPQKDYIAASFYIMNQQDKSDSAIGYVLSIDFYDREKQNDISDFICMINILFFKSKNDKYTISINRNWVRETLLTKDILKCLKRKSFYGVNNVYVNQFPFDEKKISISFNSLLELMNYLKSLVSEDSFNLCCAKILLDYPNSKIDNFIKN